MPRKKQGRKHALILYKHALDRLWMPLFPLGLLLAGILWFTGQYWPIVGYVPPIPEPFDFILYLIIVLILIFSLYALFARSMAYVQARADHIQVSTPLLSFKISYRRIKRTGMARINQIFPAQSTPGSIRSIVEKFDGETAVVLEMKGYPVSAALVRLLVGRTMLLPTTEGLVFLVRDWMELSNEIDSMQGAWRQRQAQTSHQEPANYRLLQSMRKK
jgi:hypothetical protein